MHVCAYLDGHKYEKDSAKPDRLTLDCMQKKNTHYTTRKLNMYTCSGGANQGLHAGEPEQPVHFRLRAIGIWLVGPKRLVKMEFLMLIFVFSAKGADTCIMHVNLMTNLCSTSHCLAPYVTTAHCSCDGHQIADHNLHLLARPPHTICSNSTLFEKGRYGTCVIKRFEE